MTSFEIILGDEQPPRIVQADAYQQEGPLTTFFASEASHTRLDSWSTRLASFRSAEVVMIRRIDDVHEVDFGSTSAGLRLVGGVEPV